MPGLEADQIVRRHLRPSFGAGLAGEIGHNQYEAAGQPLAGKGATELEC